MNLDELTKLMIEHGLVIRAIPYETTSTYETRHITSHPEAVIYFDERLKRDMLRVTKKNSQGGKFIIAIKRNQDSIISGWDWKKSNQNKVMFFNSIEEAVKEVSEM